MKIIATGGELSECKWTGKQLSTLNQRELTLNGFGYRKGNNGQEVMSHDSRKA